MMDTKTAKSNGVPPATAGAIGQTAPSKYIRTIVAVPVPPEAQAHVRALEKTTEVSVSDGDVLLETDPGAVKSELAPQAGQQRAVARQDPTDPGILQRRRRLRRRIAFAAIGGLGLVAIAIAFQIAVRRASASAPPSASAPMLVSAPPSAAPVAPAASVSAVSTPAVASASPPAAATSATAASSAPEPTPAPRTRPGRPRHAPTKTVR